MKQTLLLLVMLLSIPNHAWSQTRIAFLTGVERYNKSGLRDLQYAEEDALQLKEELERLGFRTFGVIGDDAGIMKLNQDLDRFITATKRLDKSDIAVVYFSGHGVQKLVSRTTDDGRTIEVEEPFFCPNDAIKSDVSTLLSLNTLLKRLSDSSGSDHNIIILDACRDSADKSGRTVGFDGNTIELSDKVAIFFAAKCGQSSYESKELEHGIFTYYLLEGLRGEAADSDNEITFHGLTNYVSKQVVRESSQLSETSSFHAQTPNLMANLSGTIVLGKIDRDSPPNLPAEQATSLTNSLGMRLVRIDAGEFMMGSEDSAEELLKMFPHADFLKEQLEDAATRHWVNINRPYFLAEHEVTVGQFRKFVETTGYVTEAESDGKGGSSVTSEGAYVTSPSYTWRSPGFNQSDEHPVVNVSWNDAMRFCQWLSRHEGKKYRLPTEAEWEYSCRAGTKTRYWNGNEAERLTEIANVGDRVAMSKYAWVRHLLTASDGFASTAPVGSFPPNPWGLYDMHGNIEEWVWDSSGYYSSERISDSPSDPNDGPLRVSRGGNWLPFPFQCTSAYRNTRRSPESRSCGTGFRVAVELRLPEKGVSNNESSSDYNDSIPWIFEQLRSVVFQPD